MMMFLAKLLAQFERDIVRLSPLVVNNANRKDHSPLAQRELAALQHAVICRERTLQIATLWQESAPKGVERG